MMDGPAHVVLTLPLPPSANRLHRQGRDADGAAVFHKSTAYRAWLKACGTLALVQARGAVPVPYRYALRITLPERRIDADNNVKPIGDFLHKFGLVVDDKHLRRLLVEIDPARDPATVLVEVWALPNPVPAAEVRARPSRPRMVRARIGGSVFLLPDVEIRRW